MVLVTLLFMFYLSWRLSLVAFVSVPAIVIVSKWYGLYIRELSKLSQVNLRKSGSVSLGVAESKMIVDGVPCSKTMAMSMLSMVPVRVSLSF